MHVARSELRRAADLDGRSVLRELRSHNGTSKFAHAERKVGCFQHSCALPTSRTARGAAGPDLAVAPPVATTHVPFFKNEPAGQSGT
eukprot:4374097-Prymnesium_polylepis.1